jgi:hypothetical protein
MITTAAIEQVAQARALTTYIGTKIIQAVPAQHVDGRAGYQVVYPDGYTSWSPASAFEAAYRQPNAMTFGDALVMLKDGKKVARAGWNGKGMWLSLSGPLAGRRISHEQFWSGNNGDFARTQPDGQAMVLPCITMKTATGEILMGWLASQSDMLAEDWQVVE